MPIVFVHVWPAGKSFVRPIQLRDGKGFFAGSFGFERALLVQKNKKTRDVKIRSMFSLQCIVVPHDYFSMSFVNEGKRVIWTSRVSGTFIGLTSLDQLRPAKLVEQAVTGNLGVSWIRLLYLF